MGTSECDYVCLTLCLYTRGCIVVPCGCDQHHDLRMFLVILILVSKYKMLLYVKSDKLFGLSEEETIFIEINASIENRTIWIQM